MRNTENWIIPAVTRAQGNRKLVIEHRTRKPRVPVAFLVQAPCGLDDKLSNGMSDLWRVMKRRCGPTARREHGGRGFRAGWTGVSAAGTAEFRGVGTGARGQEVQGLHVCGTCQSSNFSRIKRRRITRCTSHRTSALEEASDGILTELDVSARAEDPCLFGYAIDNLLERVNGGRFDVPPPVRLRIRGRCNSVSTVHTFVTHFSDRMGNFVSGTAYQYVGECLRLRVDLEA